MKVNGKQGTFQYTRSRRNGVTETVTATLNDAKRKRTGKTERDRANTKRTKVA
jgi:hypothetical protein